MWSGLCSSSRSKRSTPQALQAPLGGHADVVRVRLGSAQARVGEARKALGSLALALVEVVPDRADQAVVLARHPLERSPKQAVGLAGAVGVGGDDRVDPLAGAQQREQALVLQRLAEVHEAPAAPGADRGGGGVHALAALQAQHVRAPQRRLQSRSRCVPAARPRRRSSAWRTARIVGLAGGAMLAFSSRSSATRSARSGRPLRAARERGGVGALQLHRRVREAALVEVAAGAQRELLAQQRLLAPAEQHRKALLRAQRGDAPAGARLLARAARSACAPVAVGHLLALAPAGSHRPAPGRGRARGCRGRRWRCGGRSSTPSAPPRRRASRARGRVCSSHAWPARRADSGTGSIDRRARHRHGRGLGVGGGAARAARPRSMPLRRGARRRRCRAPPRARARARGPPRSR